MDKFDEVKNRYPEIRDLDYVLDNSLDLMEKLRAIKTAIDLRNRLMEEIGSKDSDANSRAGSVTAKIMAVMHITTMLIKKAGIQSEEKLLKKHDQAVRRLKGLDDGSEERARRAKIKSEVADKPVLLLSYYLVDTFLPQFEYAGFQVLHLNHFPLTPSAREHVLKHFSDPDKAGEERTDWHQKAVNQYINWFMNRPVDVVIEWQHGREDYPLLEMYQEVRGHVRGLLGDRYEEEIKTMPNFSNPPDFYLCLNWDGNAPDGWQEKGYRSLVDIDFDEDDLDVIYRQAMKRKKQTP